MNRLTFLCAIFKEHRVKRHFEIWKNDSICRNETFQRNKSRVVPPATRNPNSLQREKLLRFQKGMLLIQNKQSLKKYQVMAQAEAKMTLPKALVLWKINSGVQGLDGQMEHLYRDLTLTKLASLLGKHVQGQKMLALMVLERQVHAEIRPPVVSSTDIINFYKLEEKQKNTYRGSNGEVNEFGATYECSQDEAILIHQKKRKDSMSDFDGSEHTILNTALLKPTRIIPKSGFLDKASDDELKLRLFGKALAGMCVKHEAQVKSKRFFTWKLASNCFGEQLQHTINNLNDTQGQPFSLTSSF